MNAIHDMGGMHGMGPIVRDPDERPFHEPWEGRAWGLIRAMGAFRVPGRRKSFRYEHEILPPVDYLRMKYYERFIHIMVMHLLDDRVITQTELDSGKPDRGTTRTTPRLTPAMVAEQMARRGGSLRRDNLRIRARYRAGERPQHVYTVRFTARELWGEQANRNDSVYADLWEEHLERG